MVAQSRVTTALALLLGLAASSARAASPDGDVEWDGVFSDTTSQFVSPRDFAAGDTVTLSLRAYANDLTAVQCKLFFAGAGEAQVNLQKDAAASDERFDMWRGAVTIPAGATEVYYRFAVSDGPDTDFYDAGAPGDPWNIRGMQDEERSFFDFRLYPGFTVPAWSEGAVFYQIFPDRFANGSRGNDRVFPDDCLWYLDYAPASPEAAACEGYDVQAAPADYPKLCLVHEVWNEAPNGGPCDFFGGDLSGISKRLAYLDDLGATALYLNPIFRSPSNHKYDTLDFTEVDPRFGTLDELDALTRAVHGRDMRIIVDGVFNHVSDLGEMYNLWSNYRFDRDNVTGIDGFESTCGAWEDVFLGETSPLQACTSPYREWFRVWTGQDVWDVDRDGDRDEPSAHTCGWAGLGFMPEIDFGNPNTRPDSAPRQWLYGGTEADVPAVARASLAARWLVDGEVLTEGLDGWRLDVPDNAGWFTQPTGCDKAAADPTIWQGFRKAVKTAGDDKYISGEIWTDASEVGGVAQDWLRARTYDAVMNYHYFGTPISCYLTGKGVHDDAGECDPFDAMRAGNPGALSALVGHLAEQRRKYPAGAYLSSQNLISSHDSSRFASRAGGGAGALDMMRLVTAMQVTLPGAAMIYYGDELGIEGANNELGRATMAWDELAVGPTPRTALREDMRKLICARSKLEALRTGSMTSLLVDDARGLWAFSRFTDGHTAVVVLNTSDQEQTAQIPLGRAGVTPPSLFDVLGGAEVPVDGGGATVTVAARSSLILAPSGDAAAASTCRRTNEPPVADAGEDVTVTEGTGITLDGSASTDPDGRPLTYRWFDASGSGVGIAKTIDLSLVGPGNYTFRLEVSDGVYADTDDVQITITKADSNPDPMNPDPMNPNPMNPDPMNQNPANPPVAEGGCRCSGSSSAPGTLGMIFAGFVLLLRRRRR